jgi:hypothetical protein
MQDCLDLVVTGMADGNRSGTSALGDLAKPGVPRAPGVRFEVTGPRRGPMTDVAGQAERSRQLADELRVGISGLASHPVVKMSDREFQGKVGCQRMQGAKQPHTIAPARNSHDQPRISPPPQDATNCARQQVPRARAGRLVRIHGTYPAHSPEKNRGPITPLLVDGAPARWRMPVTLQTPSVPEKRAGYTRIPNSLVPLPTGLACRFSATLIYYISGSKPVNKKNWKKNANPAMHAFSKPSYFPGFAYFTQIPGT